MGMLGTSGGTATKQRRKKPDELLSSVVHETAIPAAIELMKSNKEFVFPSGTAWVLLVMNADDIGGLSRRHSRDEAKGSIIELISSDQIQTVATEAMLEANLFGIVPTRETLSRMDEYSLLSSDLKPGVSNDDAADADTGQGEPDEALGKYRWAVAWAKPNGDLLVATGERVRFATVKSVATGAASLQSVLDKALWAEHSGLAADAVQEDAVVAGDGEATPEAEHVAEMPDAAEDEGDPIFDEGFTDEPTFVGPDEVEPSANPWLGPDTNDEPTFAGEDDEPPSSGELANEPAVDLTKDDSVTDELIQPEVSEPAVAVEAEPSDADDVDEYDDEAEHVDDQLVQEHSGDGVLLADQQDVSNVLARRFLSEDLDLAVRTDEFDATFNIAAPAVQMDVPEGATAWLGEQVAQLNRQANADLAQLHSANTDKLRSTYVSLMSEHAQKVIAAVSVDAPGAHYQTLVAAARSEHETRLGEKEEVLRVARARIADEHKRLADQAAEQAALQVRVQYADRHRSRMEREQADAGSVIDRDIDAQYAQAQSEILQIRRRHAALKMASGQTQILKVLAKQQSENFDAEEARLGAWKEEINRIVADNRDADIARANVLKHEQQTSDELGALRTEQDKRVEALSTEHEHRLRRLTDELNREREDTASQMRLKDADWQHQLDLEKERTNAQAARVSDLLESVAGAENAAERRFEARLSQAEADTAAAVRNAQSQDNSRQLLLILLVVLALLCLVGGFIGGYALR